MTCLQAIERLAQLIGLNEEPPAPPGDPSRLASGWYTVSMDGDSEPAPSVAPK